MGAAEGMAGAEVPGRVRSRGAKGEIKKPDQVLVVRLFAPP